MQDNSSYSDAAPFEQDYFAPTHPDQYVESRRPSVVTAVQNISEPKASLKRSRNDSPKSDVAASTRGDNAECSGDSEPDRKRNKLTYQRSTIACVHCRRRKIRCVMPKDDESQTGKCAHCTRMKKNCSFVPVDQSVTKSKKKSATPARAVSETQSTAKAAKPPFVIDHERLFNYGATDLSYAGLLPSHHEAQSTRQRSATCSDAPTYYPIMDTLQTFPGSMDKPRSASLHGPELPLFFHEHLPMQQISHSTSASVWARSPSPLPFVKQEPSSFEMSGPDAFAASLSRLPGVCSNSPAEERLTTQSLSGSAAVENPRSYDLSPNNVEYQSNLANSMPMPQLTFESSYVNPGDLNSSNMTSDVFNHLPFHINVHGTSSSTAFQESSASSTYLLSPPTTLTACSSKSSISPVPASEAYLSPPTSEPTNSSKSRSELTPSMSITSILSPSILPPSLLTPPSLVEGLYDYAPQQGLGFTSEPYQHQSGDSYQHQSSETYKPQYTPQQQQSQQFKTSPHSLPPLTSTSMPPPMSLSMPPPLNYDNPYKLQEQDEKMQIQNQDERMQQQLVDMMYTATTGFETQGYPATSGPDDLGLYFQP